MSYGLIGVRARDSVVSFFFDKIFANRSLIFCSHTVRITGREFLTKKYVYLPRATKNAICTWTMK